MEREGERLTLIWRLAHLGCPGTDQASKLSSLLWRPLTPECGFGVWEAAHNTQQAFYKTTTTCRLCAKYNINIHIYMWELWEAAHNTQSLFTRQWHFADCAKISACHININTWVKCGRQLITPDYFLLKNNSLPFCSKISACHVLIWCGKQLKTPSHFLLNNNTVQIVLNAKLKSGKGQACITNLLPQEHNRTSFALRICVVDSTYNASQEHLH